MVCFKVGVSNIWIQSRKTTNIYKHMHLKIDDYVLMYIRPRLTPWCVFVISPVLVRIFSLLVLKHPALPGGKPEDGMSSVVFTATCYIYASRTDTSEFSMRARSYTLFVCAVTFSIRVRTANRNPNHGGVAGLWIAFIPAFIVVF